MSFDDHLTMSCDCENDPTGAKHMRAMTLIYHEDFELEISRIIQRFMVVSRYTKIREVQGARTDSMEDSDYQSNGSNHMLMLVADCDTIVNLAREFKALRKRRGHGLRGFVTPVEEII